MSADAYPWVALALSVLVTLAMRIGGLFVGYRLRPDSIFVRWITAVTYAVFAGLISNIVMTPYPALPGVSMGTKVLSIAIGLGVFFVFRRNIALGTGATMGAFYILTGA